MRRARSGYQKPEPRGTLEEQNAFYAKLEHRVSHYQLLAMADRVAVEFQMDTNKVVLSEAQARYFKALALNL